MAMLKGVNKLLLVVVGVLAVLILMVVAATFFASNPVAEPIIINSINLRNVQDPVNKAQIISAVDELVAEADNANLNEQWSKMTACLGQKCPDDAFFDTVFVTTSEFPNSVRDSDLIMNVLFVNRYWGDEERVVEFSKSLSSVDGKVSALGDRKVERAWAKIVECNGDCAEKNDLYFDMVLSVLNAN